MEAARLLSDTAGEPSLAAFLGNGPALPAHRMRTDPWASTGIPGDDRLAAELLTARFRVRIRATEPLRFADRS